LNQFLNIFLFSFIVILSVFAVNRCNEWPKLNSAIKLDAKVEARVAKLLKKMSLADKVGQMVQAEIKFVTPDEAKEYRLGSILNGGGSFPNDNKYSKISDWVAIADSYYNASMDTTNGGIAIPILWGTDAVHGHNNVIGATIFPHNIGLGAANNTSLVEDIAKATAKEVLATGIDWVFAPTVAVVRDDRWGRTYESYSERPEIVKKYAEHMVKGLQGKNQNIFSKDHLISTVKHFIGDGGTVGGIDQGDNVSSEEELLKIHGQGYISGLNAGAQTVMASFNSWKGEKLHGNKYLLTEVLKNQMGFDGFVIGDWNGHGQVDGCTNNSCAQAINAGVDMFMAPEDWKQLIENTLSQVKSGEISMDRINDAVTRILRVKVRAGLFELGAPSTRKHAGNEKIVGSEEHRKIARQAVRESLVLLKNKNNILPLTANSNIIVSGSGANNIGQQSGGWSITWQGTGNENSDFPGATSIYDGIASAVKSAGGNAQLSPTGNFNTPPDVAIVVFGETPYAEGQGDITNLNYSGTFPNDLKLLKKFKSLGIPVVSVFITGRPLWTNPELNTSDAFVIAWLPGTEGVGIADVLIGDKSGNPKFDFKGRLSFSWPANAVQTTVNVGDQDYQPLFRYGFGLSYTDSDSLGDDLDESPYPNGTQPTPNKKVSVFSGRTIAPFKNYVGDFKNWKHRIDGGAGESLGGVVNVIAVDKDVQEDARQITFNGESEANYYFQSNSSINITHYLKTDGVLSLDLRVDEHPTGHVDFLMGLSKKNLTDYLSASSLQVWKNLTISMKCFSKLGTDFNKLDMPLSIATNGALKVSIANVKIISKPKSEAIIKCN
jgi:beta-glucosidase